MHFENLQSDNSLKRKPQESLTHNHQDSKQRKVIDSDKLKDAYDSGKLNKLTVAVLSSFLNENGISTSNLRKPQLVEAVHDFYDKQK